MFPSRSAAATYRYGPLIVGGDEHDRQFVHTGKIHRFVNIALGGGAVAEQAYGDTRSLRSLKAYATPAACGACDPTGTQNGKSWTGPEEKQLPRSSPPQNSRISSSLTPRQKQRAVIAIGGQQYVFIPHRAGYSDRYRLLAERNGIGSEPPSALQCNSLPVEQAQEHHRPVKATGRLARPWRVCLGVRHAALRGYAIMEAALRRWYIEAWQMVRLSW